VDQARPAPRRGGTALAGAALAALLALWLAASAALAPGQAPLLALAVGTMLVAGKEAAIPLALGLGASPAWLAATLILADSSFSLLLFAVVQAGLDAVEGRRGYLGRVLRRAHQRAQRRRVWVDRLGAFGLYLYAIIPFAANGPPIVTAVGRLAGVRQGRVVAVLLAAITTTTVAWVVGGALGLRALGHVDRAIPFALSIGITAAAAGWALLGGLRRRPAGT